jgi:copper(I)-binding protein
MKRLTLYLLVICLFGLVTGCNPKKFGVSQVWMQPGTTNGASALYFVVDNPTDRNDVLLGASTPAAQSAELRMTVKQSGGGKTTLPQPEVSIPAQTKVLFQPDGLYFALLNLTQDLKVGDQFMVTLNFKAAGEIQLTAKVQAP